MKILSVFLLSLGFICNAYSASDKNLDTHVTITGAVYTKDTRFPLLGEAWSKLDSNGHGLIWGDAVRDAAGNLINYAMTLSDSIQYCKGLGQGAHLPSIEEWETLDTPASASFESLPQDIS